MALDSGFPVVPEAVPALLAFFETSLFHMALKTLFRFCENPP